MREFSLSLFPFRIGDWEEITSMEEVVEIDGQKYIQRYWQSPRITFTLHKRWYKLTKKESWRVTIFLRLKKMVWIHIPLRYPARYWKEKVQ